METTKSQQVQGLVFGAIALALPNLSTIISNATKNNSKAALGAGIAIIILCIASLVPGIIGILKSSAARKAATAAGEKKVIGTIGLIVSIVATVEAALVFFILGVCVACVACTAAAAMAS